MEQVISEKARVALDQDEYNRNFNKMTERFNSVKEKYDQITAQIEDKKSRFIGAEHFVKTLLSEGEIKEFSPMLWHSRLDHAGVARDGNVTFVLRMGWSFNQSTFYRSLLKDNLYRVLSFCSVFCRFEQSAHEIDYRETRQQESYFR